MKRLFLIALLLLLPAQALAQGAPSNKVQEYFDSGAALYLKGQYAEAIVEFRKAYALQPNPIFLYNIAAAERNLGNCDRAIENITRALADETLDKGTATKAMALDAGCRVRLTGDGVGKATAAMIAAAEAAKATESTTTDTATDTTDDTITATPPSEGFGTLGWTGIGLMAGGTAFLGGGTYLALSLNDTYDDYQNATEPAVQADRKDELESQRPIAWALLVGGSAIAATGLVLFLLDSGSETTVGVAPGPDGAAVWLKGSF